MVVSLGGLLVTRSFLTIRIANIMGSTAKALVAADWHGFLCECTSSWCFPSPVDWTGLEYSAFQTVLTPSPAQPVFAIFW
mgnify:CR=1 FL=1